MISARLGGRLGLKLFLQQPDDDLGETLMLFLACVNRQSERWGRVAES